MPQFDAWIDMYDDDTLKEMDKHFLMCCKLEHMFWDQADALMVWPTLSTDDASLE